MSKLKQAIKSSKFKSQKEVAVAAFPDLSKNAAEKKICKIIQDVWNSKIKDVEQIAQVLGVPFCDLIQKEAEV